jgi:Uma2 family endonuclease
MENSVIKNINELDLNKIYTYADYLKWQFDDRLELLRGFIAKMSAPSRKHQTCSRKITHYLTNFFHKKTCSFFYAPFDVRLPLKKKNHKNEEILTVVQPDICVICDEKKLDDKGCLGAPDWIIEIVSPSNPQTDLKDKYEIYQEAGVKEYWIVFPDYQSIQQNVLVNGRYVIKAMRTKGDIMSPTLFPDLKIELNEIFDE